MASRRHFIKSSIWGTTAIAGIPAIISSCISSSSDRVMAGNIGFENTILFQGDSITDSGREKQNELPNNGRSFGNGYAFLAAAKLLNDYPDKQLGIYNRGISGNKVHQLAERWQKDCLDLRPDILSILIGVNDYWHTLNSGYQGSIEIYENDFRVLLENTLKQLPGVSLVICEPFALVGGSAVNESWFPEFDGYRKAARKISEEFSTIFVPFQEVFDKALTLAPATYWAPDGVHPSMAGSQLMAAAWLKAVCG